MSSGRPSAAAGTRRLPCTLGVTNDRRGVAQPASSDPVCAHGNQVATEDQAETDRYWNAIVGNGGRESECGWCKDKWGIAWQITPIALTGAYASPDRAAARRAFDAMMTMKKIDIAVIEAAVRVQAPA